MPNSVKLALAQQEEKKSATLQRPLDLRTSYAQMLRYIVSEIEHQHIDFRPMESYEWHLLIQAYQHYSGKEGGNKFRLRGDRLPTMYYRNHYLLLLNGLPAGGCSLIPCQDDVLSLELLWAGEIGLGIGKQIIAQAQQIASDLQKVLYAVAGNSQTSFQSQGFRIEKFLENNRVLLSWDPVE